MAEPHGPDDAARTLLTIADRQERLRQLEALARQPLSPSTRRSVALVFLQGGDSGRVPFLEWLVRWKGTLPANLLVAAVTLLGERGLPVSLRLAAAVSLLRQHPDRYGVARTVGRAITKGLSPLRGLERLRAVQHLLEKSAAFDRWIERREQRLKIVCPRCRVRLPRVEMVKHLWHEHRLTFENGETRSLAQSIRLLRDDRRQHGDITALDRAAEMAALSGADPFQGYRLWLTGEEPMVAELAPLLEAAREHGRGLCPSCFAEVPASFPPVPEPLDVGHGRVAGEGYAVEVETVAWLRRLRVVTPARVRRDRLDRRFPLSRRGEAFVVAFPFAFFSVLLTQLLPAGHAVVRPLTVGMTVLTCAVYAWKWARPTRIADATTRAVDAAWTVLARRLIGKEEATRFLTRLGLASRGRGDADVRAGVRHRLAFWAESLATPSPDTLQLQAALAALPFHDRGRQRHEREDAIAGRVARGLRGEVPLPYAEMILATALISSARLRILLLAEAFEAGWRPRDLLDAWSQFPHLRAAMEPDVTAHLGWWFAAWANQDRLRVAGRERVASVFEWCRSERAGSAALLANVPDVLFIHEPTGSAAEELGLIVMTSRGVVIGGKLVANPDAIVEVSRRSGPGPAFYELMVGPHRWALVARPSEATVTNLREWLRFRHEELWPRVEASLGSGNQEVHERIFKPLSIVCPACGKACVAAVGKVGTELSRGALSVSERSAAKTPRRG